MVMAWPYFGLRDDGRLYDDNGDPVFEEQFFNSVEDAEAYLEDNDIRGNVCDARTKK